MTEDGRQPRVLSVQSHVVHGYVGNKCSVFPLQLLGLEVDFVNSVQFCCHTGYKSFAGQVLQGEQLNELVDGLETNGLMGEYTHLLTGYIGSPTFLRAVIRLIKMLPKDVAYFCDPVMGDNGKLYVPQSLVDIYRQEVVPLATVLTPNQFECELLTGLKIQCEEDAVAACRQLHSRGVKVVVLTSLDYGPTDEIVMMLSESAPEEQYTLRVPRLKAHFTGTGDLTAALLLAWMQEHPNELALVLEKTASTVAAVLERTMRVAHSRMELQLVASKRAIENPPPFPHAKCLATTGKVKAVLIHVSALTDESLLLLESSIECRVAVVGQSPDWVPKRLRMAEMSIPKLCADLQLEPSAILAVGFEDGLFDNNGVIEVAMLTNRRPPRHRAISSLDSIRRFL